MVNPDVLKKIKARKFTEPKEPEEPEEESEDPETEDSIDESKPLIIVVTKDFSGLGFAKLSLDAGYPCFIVHNRADDEEHVSEFNLVGNGIVDKIDMDTFMKNRKSFKNAYIFWDGNHSYDEGEILRSEGFKVLGGSEFTYKTENDRKYGTDLVEKAGLKTPDTFEFSTKEEGLAFLDENEDKAYVFKPDEGVGTYTTYVPDSIKAESANRELYDYLESQSGETGTYILQERKDGVEINIEYWVYEGKPFLAHANFECKRKCNHDEGCMVGCAQDVEFIVPIDCKLAKNTVAKLLELPEFKDYTGPLDMNIIVCDKEYYFLEFCNRTGYNATPNLIMNLSLLSFPEVLIKWIDGDVENFEQYFRDGFGAAVTLYIDNPRKNLPIFIDESVKFYMFEENMRDGKYYLSGYGNEVGIVCSHDYTIQRAGEKVLKDADKVNFPMHTCRTDIDRTDYESSPRLRFEACDAMRLFDV